VKHSAIVPYAVFVVVVFHGYFHLDYISMMYTPRRPVKRQLVFTPASTAKRAKTFGRSAVPFNSVQKRTTSGPSRRGTLYQQLKSLQRVVKALSPEVKTIEVNTNVTNLTSSGSIQHVTAIGQGDDVGDRTGNTIDLKEIYMQSSFTLGSDGTSGASFRIAIVRDTQQVADTTPAVVDVFSSANPLVAMPNIGNRERFKFLYMSPIVPINQLANWGMNHKFDWKGNYKVMYNGTASSDIQKGGIYILFLTDAGGNTMDFVSRVRLTFSDT